MDRRTVLAFLLIGAILILTQSHWYKERVLGIKPEPPKKQTSVTQQNKPKSESEGVSQKAPEPQITHPTAESKADVPLGISIDQSNPGEDITIETALYKGVLSSKGATVKSWKLKKYFHGKDKQSLVELIKKDGYGNLGVYFPITNDTVRTYEYVFKVDKSNIYLSERKQSSQLTFELDLGDGQLLRKRYTFYNDKYLFDLDVELVGLTDRIDDSKFTLVWLSGMKSSEKNVVEDMRNTKAYVYYAGDTEELKLPAKKNKSESKPAMEGKFDWVALRTKYFASIIFPKTENDIQVSLKGETESYGPKANEVLKTFQAGLTFKIPGSATTSFNQKFEVYLGPLDYSIIKQYHSGFGKVMGYGPAIIRPFAKLTVAVFNFLHNYIPNYGFVLIIFSILVKLVVYPLTRKSYVSMREMQKLQPIQAELKEKYGNDPQRMNKEMMKIYKEHGVNPLSGCLPNLIQMPLLWSIFLVFRNTIQLRQEPFIGWITDLSAPDTIVLPFKMFLIGHDLHILPIIMGATIFLQQKMTVTDPKQKAMVYFMPFMLMFIFYRFPAGLNLYYAIFNILSMLQQRMISTKPKVDDIAVAN